MRHRSPARFLAPLALVGFAVALLLVVTGSRGTGDEQEAVTPAVERTAEQRKTADDDDGERKSGRKRRPRTYTVRAGDTPSGIAEKTGVPLETIEELNPELDAQTLNVGDKVRIR
jgi:LysM repeat protein